MSARDSGNGREDRSAPADRRTLATPEQATRLLDEVIFERVLEHVDLASLFRLELQLWRAMIEVCPDPDARAQAKAMISAALRRIADNRDRFAVVSLGDCELCDEEALGAHEREALHRGPPRRPS